VQKIGNVRQQYENLLRSYNEIVESQKLMTKDLKNTGVKLGFYIYLKFLFDNENVVSEIFWKRDRFFSNQDLENPSMKLNKLGIKWFYSTT